MGPAINWGNYEHFECTKYLNCQCKWPTVSSFSVESAVSRGKTVRLDGALG